MIKSKYVFHFPMIFFIPPPVFLLAQLAPQFVDVDAPALTNRILELEKHDVQPINLRQNRFVEVDEQGTYDAVQAWIFFWIFVKNNFYKYQGCYRSRHMINISNNGCFHIATRIGTSWS